jgi:hypothetical protein
MPAAATKAPSTHITILKPTLPLERNIWLGVANILKSLKG